MNEAKGDVLPEIYLKAPSMIGQNQKSASFFAFRPPATDQPFNEKHIRDKA